MSNTFTGVMDPSLSLIAQNAQVFPNDRQGTLVELSALPAGASVDNIFYFNGATASTYLKRIFDGPVRAAHCGIYGDGTDQTLKLNTAFGHAGISEIIFDYAPGADILVSGTVTIPAGKRLVFRAGNKFVGTGTITGGIIDAGYDQQIFATTLTAVNPAGIATDKFSAKWFGAKGNGSTDDTVALQASIDCLIRNRTCGGHLFIPAGRYRTTKGLLVYRPGTTVNLRISGSISACTDSGLEETVIACEHSNNFGLAIQKGKGCLVEYLTFVGPNSLNFDTDFATAWNPATTYKKNANIRDNGYSPFAGIVLDPFFDLEQQIQNDVDKGLKDEDVRPIYVAAKYPEFTDYYTGISSGGSTDCKFYNCKVNGFYVGIILSPNPYTNNNESHVFDGIWLANCRDGFVTANSQERQTLCSNFKIWSSVRTCFRTIGYGRSMGDVPAIENLNVAGNIFELFQFRGVSSYFPHIRLKNIHAESFYRIGFVEANSVEIADSHFNLITPHNEGVNIVPCPDWIVGGNRLKFTNCLIISYEGGLRKPFNIATDGAQSMIEFDNCFLSNPFTSTNNPNSTLDDHNITYRKCTLYSSGRKINDDKAVDSVNSTYSSFGEDAGYGKEFITSAAGSNPRNHWRQKRKVISPMIRRIPLGSSINVTVAGDKITATATLDLPTYYTGQLVYAIALNINIPETGTTMTTGQIMRIKEINTTTKVVTFDRVISSLTTGSYNLWLMVQTPVAPITVATVSGKTATTVRSEGNAGGNNLTTPGWVLVNGRINKIVSGSSTSITFSDDVEYTQDRGIISYFEYEESGQSFNNPLINGYCLDGTAFTKGAMYTNMDSNNNANIVGWLCTRSGVKGSSIPPEFKTIYVTDNNSTTTTLNANGTIAVAAGELASYIVVKFANAATTFKIGTTAGGGEIEPGVNMVAGTSKTWNPGLFFPTAGTLYFTNVPAGTEIMVKKA